MRAFLDEVSMQPGEPNNMRAIEQALQGAVVGELPAEQHQQTCVAGLGQLAALYACFATAARMCRALHVMGVDSRTLHMRNMHSKLSGQQLVQYAPDMHRNV